MSVKSENLRIVGNLQVSSSVHGMFQNVELPDSFSRELRLLLEGLLMRDIDKRLGCCGQGYVYFF